MGKNDSVMEEAVKRYSIPTALCVFVIFSHAGITRAQEPLDAAKLSPIGIKIFQGIGGTRWQQFQASIPINRFSPDQEFGSSDHGQGSLEPSRIIAVRPNWLSAESAAKKVSRLFRDETDVKICFDPQSNTVWIQGEIDQVRMARSFLKRLDEKKSYDNSLLLVGLENIDSAEAARLINLIIFLAKAVDEDFDARVVPWHIRERTTDRDRCVVIDGTNAMKEQIQQLVLWLDAKSKKVICER